MQFYDLYVIDKNKENEKVHNHQVFDHGKEVIERIKNVPPGGGLQDIPDCYLNDHLKNEIRFLRIWWIC